MHRLAKFAHCGPGPGLATAKELGVFGPLVVESVDRTARYAQSVARANVERPIANLPGRHASESVDRLFEGVVAVRHRHGALGGNEALEDALLPFESVASTRKRTLSAPT